MSATWTPQPVWDIPREWSGERCFVICGGDSVQAQRYLVPKLRGRIIAVKHAVALRKNADVLFLSGEGTDEYAKVLLPMFTGRYVVVRGKSSPMLPETVKRVTRTKDHSKIAETPGHVAGRDSGTSAIDLAAHFGATEIVVLGMDMVGGHWFNNELPHAVPFPPKEHFVRHMEVLPAFAEDAKRKGIRIVNVSPISRVTCFERGRLEDFLDRPALMNECGDVSGGGPA